MHSTLYAGETLDPPPARAVSVATVLYAVVATAVAAVATLVVGACVLQLSGLDLEVRTSPTFARLVAGAVALLVVVAIPLRIGYRTRRAWSRLDPIGRPARVPAVLPWDLMLLAALALLTPDLTRAALTTQGAWMVRWASPPVTRAVERATRAAADRIPRQTYFTLTHRTSWPWTTAAQPACACPPVERNAASR